MLLLEAEITEITLLIPINTLCSLLLNQFELQ